jgi:hypothetical protein
MSSAGERNVTNHVLAEIIMLLLKGMMSVALYLTSTSTIGFNVSIAVFMSDSETSCGRQAVQGPLEVTPRRNVPLVASVKLPIKEIL